MKHCSLHTLQYHTYITPYLSYIHFMHWISSIYVLCYHRIILCILKKSFFSFFLSKVAFNTSGWYCSLLFLTWVFTFLYALFQKTFTFIIVLVRTKILCQTLHFNSHKVFFHLFLFANIPGLKLGLAQLFLWTTQSVCLSVSWNTE